MGVAEALELPKLADFEKNRKSESPG